VPRKHAGGGEADRRGDRDDVETACAALSNPSRRSAGRFPAAATALEMLSDAGCVVDGHL
jgi:hypothetical protein